MARRAVSPVASETEFDITKSFFDQDEDDDDFATTTTKDPTQLDANGIFGVESESDEDFIKAHQAASNRKAANVKGKSAKKGGGFQAMGLNAHLLKAISRKGFSVPTPIQRKTIPLVLDGQDVVGMARTGSGKTAAFVIPVIEKLKAHSAKVGARALILSPSRELALQTLKVCKEFGKGTDLKCVLLVGGDSIEEQFGFMASNPDIVIATPGRFLHLKVEMSLDLSSMRYVVFDEADRLFEMGFATQLTEILHALPTNRQTLLFSATLPKSLVEFARAGLQEPSLVRLDAESKISPDLQSAFFTIKSAEKEASLLYILHEIIQMPTGLPEAAKARKSGEGGSGKKRKREGPLKPTDHSTIVFTATKHHVDYVASLLRQAGFAVSHAYGSLDQTARKMQVEDFRSGMTNILVVTDVAARGIDIPILANVINYDFPPQPKIFVHRVGRTARAGQRGWSYSLVKETDAPYLLDLQLFLGKRLMIGRSHQINYAEDVSVGSLPRDKVEVNNEWVTKLLREDGDLSSMKSVSVKGEKLYTKTRNSASNESAKRAKDLISAKTWAQLHPLFSEEVNEDEQVRTDLLEQIASYRPRETVFEIGHKGKTGQLGEAAEIMRNRRESINPRKQAKREEEVAENEDVFSEEEASEDFDSGMEVTITNAQAEEEINMDEASANDLEQTFSKAVQKGRGRTLAFRDQENFMSYTPRTLNAAEERGYGVHSGSTHTGAQHASFIEAARGATMDLMTEDSKSLGGGVGDRKGRRWDKRHSKYVDVRNDDDGSRGAKMVRGESGVKIAASFQSGRFERWRKANKVARLPRTGEAEVSVTRAGGGARYRHRQERAPKEADRWRDDFHVRRKRVEAAKEARRGRFREGAGKGEVRSVEEVRRERKAAEAKRAKHARVGGKGKGKGGG